MQKTDVDAHALALFRPLNGKTEPFFLWVGTGKKIGMVSQAAIVPSSPLRYSIKSIKGLLSIICIAGLAELVSYA
jgi:hypothetical protein